MFLDLKGTPDEIHVNTVSGDVTARLADGVPAHYKINTVSGRLQLDDSDDHGRPRQLHRQVRGPRQDLARLQGEHRQRQCLACCTRCSVMTPAVFAHGHLRLYLLSLLAEAAACTGTSSSRRSAIASAAPTSRAPARSIRGWRSSRRRGSSPSPVDGRKTVYAITDAGRAELAAREGELDGIESELSDSVRRLADEVRSSVSSAMKTLRADLAAAAQDARDEAKRAGREVRDSVKTERVESRSQLQEAELLLSEFRHQVRSELRRKVMQGELTAGNVAVLREGLDAVRTTFMASLRDPSD